MKQEHIADAYRKVAYISGHPGDLYVQRPEDYAVSELIYKELLFNVQIRQHHSPIPKYLLVGLRGTGKTTELQNLKRLLENEPDSPMLPVFVSIIDYSNPITFDFTEIPLVFTSALAEHLESLGIETII
jgi:hypothetical protein